MADGLRNRNNGEWGLTALHLYSICTFIAHFGKIGGEMSGENGDLGLYLYSTCTFIAQKLPNAPTEIHVKIVYLYSISTHTAKK